MFVGNKFPPLPRKHGRVSCGTTHRNENSCSANEFLIKPKHHLSDNLLDVANFCRLSL